MKKFVLATLLLAFSACAFAQQDYVGRFDSFAGFTYLDTPNMNLMERGFITQEGVNLNRWLAFGVDYSIVAGHSTIFPNETKDAATLNGEIDYLKLVGAVPQNYSLFIPYNSTTSTYTAGPQINIRKFKKVTLFVHPDIGAIHEVVTARPIDAVQTGVAQALSHDTGQLKDTTYFYGVGGGAQYGLTKHFGLRFTFDYVHLYLYSDLLANSRDAFRFGIGPSFSFGKNVK